MTDADFILLLIALNAVPVGIGLAICFRSHPRSAASIIQERLRKEAKKNKREKGC